MATVGEVMTRDVVCVREDMPLQELACRLASREMSAVPVLDASDRLVGLASMASVAVALARSGAPLPSDHPPLMLHLRSFLDEVPGDEAFILEGVAPDLRVGDVMNRECQCVAEEDPLEVAVDRLLAHTSHRLVVVDPERKVVGILTTRDLIRVLRRMLAGESPAG